jgi:hypothetical protein
MAGFPEWIAVDAEGGVVDFYRLLDLETGESDPGSIRFAIDRVRAGLGREHREDGSESLRTLIDRAEEILTDPRRKVAYDEALASRNSRASGPVGRARSRFSLRALPRLAPGQRWRLAVTAIALLVTTGLVTNQVARAPATFPAHRGAVPPAKPADLVTSRLAPPPPKPTVTGLTLGYPRKLPGLQDEPGASAPTLSADLRVLVFVKDNGPSHHDLFITTRDDPGRAFSKPVAMGACNTDASEEYPTLSRDALELLFLRDRRPFSATRTSVSERFRPARPIVLPEVNFDAEEIDHLSLNPDGMTLTFRTLKKAEGAKDPWSYRVAERTTMAEPFEKTGPLPVWSPWAANVLSVDGLRCYVATGEGLSISSRLGLDRGFALPGLIQRLTPARVGPILGPFWVAPKEDLIVFSSPGSETGDSRGRRDAGHPPYLWMVQFR